MPRGVRGKVNYDEQISAIDCKLERYAKYTAELKERRQELLRKRQQQTMKDLQAYMESHNLQPSEVIAKLQNVAVSGKPVHPEQ